MSPSPQSATPSRCSPPVTATQARQPMISYIEGQDNGERLATININHLNAVAIIYFKSNNILGIH